MLTRKQQGLNKNYVANVEMFQFNLVHKLHFYLSEMLKLAEGAIFFCDRDALLHRNWLKIIKKFLVVDQRS